MNALTDSEEGRSCVLSREVSLKTDRKPDSLACPTPLTDLYCHVKMYTDSFLYRF